MSTQFLSLDDAAKRLGVTTEQLVAYRSEGRVRGFRDGSSWKFAETEIDRLKEDLSEEGDAYDPYRMADEEAAPNEPSAAEGSGILFDDLDISDAARSGGSSLIGSDVNLVAGDGDDGSDVKVVSSAVDDDSDFMLKDRREGLVEIDSGELKLSLDEPAITHDSEYLDLAIDPKTGSTGPIAKKDMADAAAAGRSDSDLSFEPPDDLDSDDDLLGASDSEDVLGDFASPTANKGGSSVSSSLSSLELMDDLDLGGGSDLASGIGSGLGSSSGLAMGMGNADVLSELDILSSDAGGSGLISGDSGKGIGSGLDLGLGSGTGGSGLSLDDDDDDLLITDNDDELVLGGSDLSISGDSGINLMSPSDSGISLESEPLDLAGSSISALDLGGEIGSGRGSSGKGIGSSSGVGPEDFQLSPSGLSIDTDSDSSSQVIEVEDSAAFAGDVNAADFGEAFDGDEGFVEEAGEGGFGDEDALAVEDGFDEEPVGAGRGGQMSAYEIPYSLFQVIGLVSIVTVMSLGGMLMSDLVRNIWTYSEPAAPVSGLTDWLIQISPFDS